MRIAGLEKCSFVDYPDCLSAVVFTPGCNMNCFYCHNRQLIAGPQPASTNCPAEPHSIASVLDFLARRRGMLDALVVTGGEPTLQPGLDAFLDSVRAMGFKLKLDTNGTKPDVLKNLLDMRLVDFVAMDVKAPTDLYERICEMPVDQAAISRSVALLLAGRVRYEFRTTFAPPLTREDILRIALRIRGAANYVLQQYRPTAWAGEETFDLRSAAAPPTHADAYIRATAEALRPFVKHCSVRGLNTAAAKPTRPAATRLAVATAAQA